MRLFFALWPPPAIATALAGEALAHAERLGGRATRAETVHMTLAFIGDCPAASVPDVVAAAGAVPPFDFSLTLDRLGCFRRQRLLWVGCEAAPDGLSAQVAALHRALLQARVAFDATHAFLPHCTLVRQLPSSALSAAPRLSAPIVWRCGGFVLVESVLSSSGPGYRTVAAFGTTPRPGASASDALHGDAQPFV